MANPIYVKPGDKNRFASRFEPHVDNTRKIYLESLWKHFNRPDPATGQSYYIWYRPTNRKLEMYVDYSMPVDAPSGRYRVEVFIPGRNATTRQAAFTIANNFRETSGQLAYEDTLIVVDMYHLYDVWHPLGEYFLEPAKNTLSGRVRQYETTLEDPPEKISFGPVRWVPLFAEQPPVGSGRFDPPIGSEDERGSPLQDGLKAFGLYPLWVGKWYDANPYLTWYSYGYHTGADLNLPGGSDADKDAPIYASGDGLVVYAGAAGNWGNIIVIEHPSAVVTLPSGEVRRQRVYTRYGHVTNNIQVSAGQSVNRGQLVGFVGLPKGYLTGWHLHFDVCYTNKLGTVYSHWPDMRKIRELQSSGISPNSAEFREAQMSVKKEVLAHYLDPFMFIKDNRGF